MKIFTQLRINILFSATKLFSQISERSQLSKNIFNDVCGIVELSCVEDKEELVNIGNMKVRFHVSCQIIVCLTHCIINMDTKGKRGSNWTMDEDMLLIEQSKLKDEECLEK
jgi:hypothetical protein